MGGNDPKKNGEQSPPLQIDPKCFQDALRTFFQPLKTDDPRLNFYTLYKREATEYDVDYVKKYDEDLNTTLIFAGLFSAVSSAFVIDVYPKLQPDPNDQSAALLRAILLTLNQSAIPNEPPAIPPVQDHPPSEIVTATALLYASLLISLLAAFVAMLGKQWLNRYLRHSGGSMIERCGDRQRKCDGLDKWPSLHLFIESLPVMLQIALLLLACGLCRYMESVNTTVAYILFTLTGLGVVFYVGVVIAGASSHDCPFQTPASVPLRSLWKKARLVLAFVAFPIFIAFRTLGEIFEFRMFQIITHLPNFDILPHLHDFSEKIQLATLRLGLFLPRTGSNLNRSSRHPLLPTTREDSGSTISEETIPWFEPGELAKIQAKNTDDVRCVSWVIKTITDPEVLDAAILRASTIRWFDDGIEAEPVYNLITNVFHTCFGSNGEVYPGLRDRAYYSLRAIIWIHTLGMCKSLTFPLPFQQCRTADLDDDFQQLLDFNGKSSIEERFGTLLLTRPGSTPSHVRWVSNALLYLSWAQLKPDGYSMQFHWGSADQNLMPLDALLNRLLMYCNLLDSPVEEELLKVQDKSDRLSFVLDRVVKAITSTLNTPHPRYELIQDTLLFLTLIKEHIPWRLTKVAYEWSAVFWKNREDFQYWNSLLSTALEVGFRHHDPQKFRMLGDLTHTQHHQELADVVFKSNWSESIADLLCALIAYDHDEPAVKSIGIYKRHIADLHNNFTGPFSLRLRQLVVRSIELIGHEGFGEGEAGKFIGLLNHLCIGVENLDWPYDWASMLVEIIQTTEGTRRLAIQAWEFLVKVAISYPWAFENVTTYDPRVTDLLLGGQEWEKLECWLGVVWLAWVPETDRGIEDIRSATNLLFRQKPEAIRRLTQWMEDCTWRWARATPAPFREICERAQLDATSGTPPNGGGEGSPHLLPPTQSAPSVGGRYRESLPLI